MDISQTSSTDVEHKDFSRRTFLKLTGMTGLATIGAGSFASVLAGCGGGSDAGSGSSTTPFSFWNFYGPGGQVKEQSQWFVGMAAQWNKANKTQVKLQYVPTNDYINGSKLQTFFAAGDGPTFFC